MALNIDINVNSQQLLNDNKLQASANREVNLVDKQDQVNTKETAKKKRADALGRQGRNPDGSTRRPSSSQFHYNREELAANRVNVSTVGVLGINYQSFEVYEDLSEDHTFKIWIGAPEAEEPTLFEFPGPSVTYLADPPFDDSGTWTYFNKPPYYSENGLNQLSNFKRESEWLQRSTVDGTTYTEYRQGIDQWSTRSNSNSYWIIPGSNDEAYVIFHINRAFRAYKYLYTETRTSSFTEGGRETIGGPVYSGGVLVGFKVLWNGECETGSTIGPQYVNDFDPWIIMNVNINANYSKIKVYDYEYEDNDVHCFKVTKKKVTKIPTPAGLLAKVNALHRPVKLVPTRYGTFQRSQGEYEACYPLNCANVYLGTRTNPYGCFGYSEEDYGNALDQVQIYKDYATNYDEDNPEFQDYILSYFLGGFPLVNPYSYDTYTHWAWTPAAGITILNGYYSLSQNLRNSHRYMEQNVLNATPRFYVTICPVQGECSDTNKYYYTSATSPDVIFEDFYYIEQLRKVGKPVKNPSWFNDSDLYIEYYFNWGKPTLCKTILRELGF